eukprot:TRINITY_DN7728_c0_g1_i1.p1 TRINITY_DN7728_c0_g1~~TRINITY_DN7728_c0_g1_i1.p1  ORF type:complete len:522 (+),score=93.54 TRINITY_DN7728_c0_g1_i1:41-1606(+)
MGRALRSWAEVAAGVSGPGQDDGISKGALIADPVAQTALAPSSPRDDVYKVRRPDSAAAEASRPEDGGLATGAEILGPVGHASSEQHSTESGLSAAEKEVHVQTIEASEEECCPVCDGTGKLLSEPCPLCEDAVEVEPGHDRCGDAEQTPDRESACAAGTERERTAHHVEREPNRSLSNCKSEETSGCLPAQAANAAESVSACGFSASDIVAGHEGTSSMPIQPARNTSEAAAVPPWRRKQQQKQASQTSPVFEPRRKRVSSSDGSEPSKTTAAGDEDETLQFAKNIERKEQSKRYSGESDCSSVRLPPGLERADDSNVTVMPKEVQLISEVSQQTFAGDFESASVSHTAGMTGIPLVILRLSLSAAARGNALAPLARLQSVLGWELPARQCQVFQLGRSRDNSVLSITCAQVSEDTCWDIANFGRCPRVDNGIVCRWHHPLPVMVFITLVTADSHDLELPDLIAKLSEPAVPTDVSFEGMRHAPVDNFSANFDGYDSEGMRHAPVDNFSANFDGYDSESD